MIDEKTKFFIDRETGSVYFLDKELEGEICFAPLVRTDDMNVNSFSIEEGGVVDIWDTEEGEQRIKGFFK